MLDHRCVCLNQGVQLLIHCSLPNVVSLRSLFVGFGSFIFVVVVVEVNLTVSNLGCRLDFLCIV